MGQPGYGSKYSQPIPPSYGGKGGMDVGGMDPWGSWEKSDSKPLGAAQQWPGSNSPLGQPPQWPQGIPGMGWFLPPSTQEYYPGAPDLSPSPPWGSANPPPTNPPPPGGPPNIPPPTTPPPGTPAPTDPKRFAYNPHTGQGGLPEMKRAYPYQRTPNTLTTQTMPTMPAEPIQGTTKPLMQTKPLSLSGPAKVGDWRGTPIDFGNLDPSTWFTVQMLMNPDQRWRLGQYPG